MKKNNVDRVYKTLEFLEEFQDEYSYSLIVEEEEEYEDEKIIGSNDFKKEGNKKYTVTSQNFIKNRKEN